MKRYGVFAYLLSAVLVGCSTDSKPVAPAAEIAPAAKSTTETTLTPDQARKELTRQGIEYTGTMFLLYAQYGMLDAVKLFVQAGMPLTTKNPDDDFTALHQAATYGHLAVVKYLVGQGAAVDAEGKSGETPFIWAAWNGHLEIVKYLREQGASLLNSTPVGAAHRLAKDAGHTAVVTYIEGQAQVELAKHGVPFTTREFILSVGRSSQSRVQSRVVKLFVQAGMSLASMDNVRTALHQAVYVGPLEIVKYLVEQGGQPNGKGRLRPYRPSLGGFS